MKTAVSYAQRDLATIDRALPLVKGRRAALQAGACLGIFPLHLAKMFEAVYAFEPDPKLFRKSVMLGNVANIVWFNAALGYERRLVHTECRRRDGSSRPAHEGLTFTIAGGIIPTMRVDDLALSALDLLCLDVEGAEFEALKGAKETIDRCRPVLIVEINKQLQHSGITEDDLRTCLRVWGYEWQFKNYSDEVFVPWQK